MDMRLNHEPFLSIKAGTKKIEVRLNDEKRSQLNVGDRIRFTDLETAEILNTEVLGLETFPTFKNLFAKYSGVIIGAPVGESVDELDRENVEIYSRDREEKYGALAIRVEVI